MLAQARLLALALPAALLATVWAMQLFGGYYPCEMCHWQRWPHYAALVAAVLAIVLRKQPASRPLTILAGLLIIVSGAIGAFHAGVEYHWWQGPTRCSSMVAAHGADLLQAILSAPLVRCDTPAWTLFGISLAGYNAIVSFAGGLTILGLCRR